MDHVALLKKEWGLLAKLLDGSKTIESRWYMQRRVPWNKVAVGDNVYFKNSGEPVVACARVTRVLQVELNQGVVRALLEEYGDRLGLDDVGVSFARYKDKKYCVLIFLGRVRRIQPFDIDKRGFGNMCAWLRVPNVRNIQRTV